MPHLNRTTPYGK